MILTRRWTDKRSRFCAWNDKQQKSNGHGRQRVCDTTGRYVKYEENMINLFYADKAYIYPPLLANVFWYCMQCKWLRNHWLIDYLWRYSQGLRWDTLYSHSLCGLILKSVVTPNKCGLYPPYQDVKSLGRLFNVQLLKETLNNRLFFLWH